MKIQETQYLNRSMRRKYEKGARKRYHKNTGKRLSDIEYEQIAKHVSSSPTIIAGINTPTYMASNKTKREKRAIKKAEREIVAAKNRALCNTKRR